MAQLIEPTELPELGMTVGFLHVPGAGFRVGTLSEDGFTRHFAIAAARRLAKELAEAGDPELVPAVALLRAKCDRLEGWLEGRRDAAQIAEFEALRAEGAEDLGRPVPAHGSGP